MPFSLERWGDKAIVVNSMTGKHYSSNPIPLQSARRQLQVLKQSTETEVESESESESEHSNPGNPGKWIQSVVESPSFKKGAFTAQAKKAGVSTMEFKDQVLSNPDKYSVTTVRRARFLENIQRK